MRNAEPHAPAGGSLRGARAVVAAGGGPAPLDRPIGPGWARVTACPPGGVRLLDRDGGLAGEAPGEGAVLRLARPATQAAALSGGAVRLAALSGLEAALIALTRALRAAGRDPARFARRIGPVLRRLSRGEGFVLPDPAPGPSASAYRAWRDARALHPPPDDGPEIAVLMAVHRPDPSQLASAIASVRAQTWPRWRLVCVDDAGGDRRAAAILAQAAAGDARIAVLTRAENGGVSRALNDALAAATAPWAGVLDQDDVLAKDALAAVAAAAADPAVRLIYTDQDKIDAAGRPYEPDFKPGWSPDLLLGQNYLNHFTVFRREEALAAGGFDPAFDGAQDHDLYLRLSVGLPRAAVRRAAGPLYSWRATAGSTARDAGEKPLAVERQRAAVAAHLGRIGLAADVAPLPGAPYTVFLPRLPAPAPRVAVLTPTRDRPDLLAHAARAVLEADYPALDWLIVDNGSRTPAARDQLSALAQDPRVRVLVRDEPFNFARLMNAAAAATRAEVLVLLNDDVEAPDRGWLSRLVAHAVRPDVGPVGALLTYPDGRIQHAGVVLGVGGAAGHRFKGAPGDAPGPFHRLRLTHEVAAVTGACLAVRAQVWRALSGLDEAAFAVGFNDVDFCLRAWAAGYRTLLCPHARLIHHESATRGADDADTPERRAERARFQARWAGWIADDPFYHPALTRLREDATLAP